MDTRIELTPVGRYVDRLLRADRRLDGLTHPGIFHRDEAVKKIATSRYETANALRAAVREELHRFDGEPIGRDTGGARYPDDYDGPGSDAEAPASPTVPAHLICSVCGIANIHGPSCFAEECPRRRSLYPQEPRGPLCETCDDRGYIYVAAGSNEMQSSCPDCNRE